MPCISSDEQWDHILEGLKLQAQIDRRIKAELLMFRTPLASLTCEAMKKLEELGLVEGLSNDLKRWWSDHKKRDGGLTYLEGTPEFKSKEYEQDVLFYETLIHKY